MSGIETIKIIVDAEKEAAKMLEDAQGKASRIRKNLDLLIQEQREETLSAAKKEAAAIVQRAEEDGKLEAQKYTKESTEKTRRLVTNSSAKKNAAVEKLVTIVIEGRA